VLLLILQCLPPLLPFLLLAPALRSFCWGGLYAVLLAQGQTPKVSAAGVYHGSSITPADVEAVTAPINFQQSDPALDRQIPSELYKQVRPAVAATFLSDLVHCPQRVRLAQNVAMLHLHWMSCTATVHGIGDWLKLTCGISRCNCKLYV
jgi:hypothetical protein